MQKQQSQRRPLRGFLPALAQAVFTNHRLWVWLNWSCLGLGSSFLGAAFFFTYNWNANPLLWRVFNKPQEIFGPANHHTLIMLTIGLTFIGMVILKIKPFVALVGIYFAVEAHEAEWYVAYLAQHIAFGVYFQWWWFVVTVGSVPVIVIYAWLFRVPWKFLLWMAPYYAIWAVIGFPITEDFTGNTIFYNTLWDNGIEFGSWLYAFIGFWLLEYKFLLSRSDTLKLKWWTSRSD